LQIFGPKWNHSLERIVVINFKLWWSNHFEVMFLCTAKKLIESCLISSKFSLTIFFRFLRWLHSHPPIVVIHQNVEEKYNMNNSVEDAIQFEFWMHSYEFFLCNFLPSISLGLFVAKKNIFSLFYSTFMFLFYIFYASKELFFNLHTKKHFEFLFIFFFSFFSTFMSYFCVQSLIVVIVTLVFSLLHSKKCTF
jgi:hypothetical protein